MVYYWIKNISRNIEAVFFKLGTRNVHHEINKMTPVVLLLWQRFCRWSCTVQIRIESLSFCLNQVLSTPSNLMRRVYTILEPCLFQTGPPVTHKGLQTGIFRFWRKETGAKRVAMARAPQVSFCFICDVHFWLQVWRSLRQSFKIFLIQYFTILVTQFTTSSLS